MESQSSTARNTSSTSDSKLLIELLIQVSPGKTPSEDEDWIDIGYIKSQITEQSPSEEALTLCNDLENGSTWLSDHNTKKELLRYTESEMEEIRALHKAGQGPGASAGESRGRLRLWVQQRFEQSIQELLSGTHSMDEDSRANILRYNYKSNLMRNVLARDRRHQIRVSDTRCNLRLRAR